MGHLAATELADRYEALYTGAVVDVLDELGHLHQTLDPGIDPLEDGMTTAGIAYPIVGRYNESVDPEANIRTTLRMLGEAPADAVLVYQTNDDRAAHFGELSAAALQTAGCRGAVIDGGARDTSYIVEHGFPTFTRYRTPADAVPRWEVLDWDVSAVVGGVEVSPGDVVVGDMDGVVVVPRHLAEEVLTEAEALSDAEDAVREAVRGGTAPLDAYEEYGTF